MTWPQTGATKYHAHLGPSDKGRATKGNIQPFDMLNGVVVLGFYEFHWDMIGISQMI